MKTTIIFTLVLLCLLSCNSQKEFKDVNEYNKAIISSFYKVQVCNDSLERMLLNLKYSIEMYPQDTYNSVNYIDTIRLQKLFNDCLVSTAKARKEIQNLHYQPDSFFKPAILKGLDMIENNLNFAFKPLCDSVVKMNGRLNVEVTNAILPWGKQSFRQYQAAFDTIIVGQMKLNNAVKYQIDSKLIIRFAF